MLGFVPFSQTGDPLDPNSERDRLVEEVAQRHRRNLIAVGATILALILLDIRVEMVSGPFVVLEGLTHEHVILLLFLTSVYQGVAYLAYVYEGVGVALAINLWRKNRAANRLESAEKGIEKATKENREQDLRNKISDKRSAEQSEKNRVAALIRLWAIEIVSPLLVFVSSSIAAITVLCIEQPGQVFVEGAATQIEFYFTPPEPQKYPKSFAPVPAD